MLWIEPELNRRMGARNYRVGLTLDARQKNMTYLIKVVVSALMIVAITEATKRFGFWGSLLASLPLLSLISMLWIYIDTKDIQKISTFSIQLFWFVIPSLGLFASLPWLLGRYSFYVALIISIGVTITLYLAMLALFRLFHYNPLA
jgi:hypothetical protein